MHNRYICITQQHRLHHLRHYVISRHTKLLELDVTARAALMMEMIKDLILQLWWHDTSAAATTVSLIATPIECWSNNSFYNTWVKSLSFKYIWSLVFVTMAHWEIWVFLCLGLMGLGVKKDERGPSGGVLTRTGCDCWEEDRLIDLCILEEAASITYPGGGEMWSEVETFKMQSYHPWKETFQSWYDNHGRMTNNWCYQDLDTARAIRLIPITSHSFKTTDPRLELLSSAMTPT